VNADVILLAHFREDTEVGLYRGAVMLLSLLSIVAETLSTGVFPRMARLIGQPGQAGEELHFVSRVMLAFSLPAATGGFLLATPLLIFIGGADFAGSAPLFKIMIFLIPFRFLSNCYGMTLSALDQQSDRTRGALLAAVFNLAVNAWALPHYGAVGAATTTLCTEILLFCWMQWRVSSVVEGLRLDRILLQTGIPALCMGIFLFFLPSLHVLIAIGLGGMVFAGIGYGTGAWNRKDFSRLRKV